MWRRAGDFLWWEAALPGARVRFSTRQGGASTPPYDGLNLGLHVGDAGERVIANRREFLAAALAGEKAPVVADQVHGVAVAMVSAADAGRGWERRVGALPGTDALVTREPGLPLAILVADCAPVALVAPGGIVGAVHAGWRGLAAGLLEATLARMAELGGSPETVSAVVGPCIRGCCYEIGEEVWRQFPEACLRPGSRPDRRRLDLLAAVRERLADAGAPRQHVHAPGLCTACHSTLFFSHRRASGAGAAATGRMALFVTAAG